eukprot:GEMP01001195.1.p1 GENE.GEMP01001195.1~~GEMP01001195.1.p1  ORF type:complete len:1467 (+),score=303.43 GEMP01001195.1:400-4800(+)
MQPESSKANVEETRSLPHPPLISRNFTSTILDEPTLIPLRTGDLSPSSDEDGMPELANASAPSAEDAQNSPHTTFSASTIFADDFREARFCDESWANESSSRALSRFSGASIRTIPSDNYGLSDRQSPIADALKEALCSQCAISKNPDCTVCSAGHSFDFLQEHKGEWLELHHSAPLFVDSTLLHKVMTLENHTIIKLITLVDWSLLVDVKYVADGEGFVESDVRGWISIAEVQSEWFTNLAEKTRIKLRNFRLVGIYKPNRNYRTGLAALARKTVSRESEKVATIQIATALGILEICPNRTRACIRQVSELGLPQSVALTDNHKSKPVEGWISTTVEKIGIPLLWSLHSDIEKFPLITQKFLALARHGADNVLVPMLKTSTQKAIKTQKSGLSSWIDRGVSKVAVHWGGHEEVATGANDPKMCRFGSSESIEIDRCKSPASAASRQSHPSPKRRDEDSTHQFTRSHKQKDDSDPTQRRSGHSRSPRATQQKSKDDSDPKHQRSGHSRSPRETQRKSKKNPGWFSMIKKSLIGGQSPREKDTHHEGLSVNVMDAFERTALHYAVEYGHTRLGEILVKDFQADLDIRDFEGKTPLHLAAMLREAHVWGPCDGTRDSLVKLLLSHDADVNACDFSGKTPLYTVCEDFTEPLLASVVHMLLDAGADPTLVDGSGMTPFDVLSNQETALKEKVLGSSDLIQAQAEKLKAIDLVKLLIEKKTDEPNFRQTDAQFPFQDTCPSGENQTKRRMSTYFNHRTSASTPIIENDALTSHCDEMPRTPSDFQAYERLVSGMLLRNAIKESDFITVENLLQEFKVFDIEIEPELKKEAEVICIDNYGLFKTLTDCHQHYLNFSSGAESNPDTLVKLVAGLLHTKGHPAAKRYARAETALKSRHSANAFLRQHWDMDRNHWKGDTDDVLFAYKAVMYWQSKRESQDIDPDMITAASEFAESVRAVHEHVTNLYSAALSEDGKDAQEDMLLFLRMLVTKASEDLLGGMHRSRSYLRFLHLRLETAIQTCIQKKTPPEVLAHAHGVRQYLVEEIISTSKHSTFLHFSATPESAIKVDPTANAKIEGYTGIAVRAKGKVHEFTARSIYIGSRPNWNRFLDLPNTLAAGFNSLVFFHGDESLWLMMDFLRNASSGLLSKRERPNFCPYNMQMSMFQLQEEVAFDLLTNKDKFAKEPIVPTALDSAELQSINLDSAQKLEDAVEHMYNNLSVQSINNFYTVIVVSVEGQASVTLEDSSIATTKSALVLINCGSPAKRSSKAAPKGLDVMLSVIEEEHGESSVRSAVAFAPSSPTITETETEDTTKADESGVNPPVDTAKEDDSGMNPAVDTAKEEGDTTAKRVNCPVLGESATESSAATRDAIVKTMEAAGDITSSADGDVAPGLESRDDSDGVNTLDSSLAAEVKAICAKDGTLSADGSKTPLEHVVDCLLGEHALKRTNMVLSLQHHNRDVNATVSKLKAFL